MVNWKLFFNKWIITGIAFVFAIYSLDIIFTENNDIQNFSNLYLYHIGAIALLLPAIHKIRKFKLNRDDNQFLLGIGYGLGMLALVILPQLTN